VLVVSAQQACLSTQRGRRPWKDDGLTFDDFVSPLTSKASMIRNSTGAALSNSTIIPPVFHIKTYGCQMNVNDTDIVRSLLYDAGWRESADPNDADLLLSNTCAIREGAEQKVWQRLRELRGQNRKLKRKRRKIIGVLGCMAERLQEDLLQDGLADLVVGPDAYRDLPRLAGKLMRRYSDDDDGYDDIDPYAVNVQLSLDETYADITPIRANQDDVSAFVSIQRGCANRCSFCIVPFTRGQERSRPLDSIIEEIQRLHFDQGIKEITLLGQNVNSYHDVSEAALQANPTSQYQLSNDGFRSRIRRPDGGYYFADLVERVSDLSPELRVRFTSPHPKDYPSALLELMAERSNVCNHLHMPAQSGSTTMLKRMKRGYSREAYLELIFDNILPRIPDIALSTDMIAGFCGETEEEHADSVSLLEQVGYDQAFLFAYSLREKTHAHRTMEDNVPEEIKQQRLRQLIDTFQVQVQKKNTEKEVGKLRLVLVEGPSKRSTPESPAWHGRTDQNKRIIFPVQHDLSCVTDDKIIDPVTLLSSDPTIDPIIHETLRKGDYAVVEVTEARGHTLRGRMLYRTTLRRFTENFASIADKLDPWRYTNEPSFSHNSTV
jgi:MiaB/RimO family radical SAM methylthiotransferase